MRYVPGFSYSIDSSPRRDGKRADCEMRVRVMEMVPFQLMVSGVPLRSTVILRAELSQRLVAKFITVSAYINTSLKHCEKTQMDRDMQRQDLYPYPRGHALRSFAPPFKAPSTLCQRFKANWHISFYLKEAAQVQLHYGMPRTAQHGSSWMHTTASSLENHGRMSAVHAAPVTSIGASQSFEMQCWWTES
ncbi:uncharacterized protein BDR25DRAFT_397251 [Lindgomyces ingoldianus]|uniref:Uncharacterized protein n=1 Tax=Lindgomyces ingoldianus TaxID=673940 RepID=A0ACB6Q8R5_9PLEO|nr:uncharacterized protein BDR25DRAFT_397251 [Lindgomyces ingoldianus]KAF2463286.1 hypothetical protein BDR25DRAFT_397251 [Lindgomyces ingoldianus]